MADSTGKLHLGGKVGALLGERFVKLPGAQSAIVDSSKICDYLLSTTHAVGHTKARFFGRLGFEASRWEELQTQLLALALFADAELAETTPFGQKYHVRGIIRGPSGRAGGILTVWIIRHGEPLPRLVTAIPVASL